jgi:hypothetical protein
MDLLSPNRLGVASIQDRRACEHTALLADGLSHADDYIVELRGIELIAIPNSLKQLRSHFNRGYFVQRTIRPALAAWGAYMIVNIGFH